MGSSLKIENGRNFYMLIIFVFSAYMVRNIYGKYLWKRRKKGTGPLDLNEYRVLLPELL